MLTIPNVTTGNGYTDACTLEDANAIAATYVVANAAVVAQFRPKRTDGSLAPYGPELLLSPQSNNMVGVAGMRFRSAVAGVPAQIIAAMYDRDDPLPGAATPFSQTISSSGAVTPGASAVQIQKDGALVGAEPILDFVTGLGLKIVAADDVANTRVTLELDLSAIADSLLGSAASSVDIQNIPQTYAALELLYNLNGDGGWPVNVNVRFNNDSGADYDYNWSGLSGAGVAAGLAGAGGGVLLPGRTGAAGRPNSGVLYVPNYTAARVHMTTGLHAESFDSVTAGNQIAALNMGVWRGPAGVAAAINRLAVFCNVGNLVTGSRITLGGRPAV